MSDQLPKKRTLLLNCLAVSVGVHVFFVFLYLQYPLIFYPALASLFHFNSAKATVLLQAQERDEILEEVFQEFLPSTALIRPNEGDFLLLDQNTAPEKEERTESNALPLKLSLSLQESQEGPSFFSVDVSHLKSPSFSPIVQQSPGAYSSIEKDLLLSSALPSIEKLDAFEDDAHSVAFSLETPLQERGPAAIAQFSEALSFSEKRENPLVIEFSSNQNAVPLSSVNHNILEQPPEGWDNRSLAGQESVHNFEEYKIFEDLAKVDWEEEFSSDIELLPLEKEGKYLFSISLSPNYNMAKERLAQNFYFLIDGSSSIQKHRFQTFKRALQKALPYLQEGDSFNIYILGRKMIKLSEKNLSVKPSSLQLAQQFLEKEEYVESFSSAEIYPLLDKCISISNNEKKLHTAILLTDGETLLAPKEQQRGINRWLQKNLGKISLYTAAVGQKNNLILLDLISSSSKGKLFYSDTHAAFPRKFAKFVKDLNTPIVHDVRITIVPVNKNSTVRIYPSTSRLPNFYAESPYHLIGLMDELTDFRLILEGKHGDQWVNIEKAIHFEEIKKGGAKLQKKWVFEQAHLQYEEFLNKGNPSFLEDARELLKPLVKEIAWQ